MPRFNVTKMFELIDRLDDGQALSEDKIIKIVGAKAKDGIKEYRAFLTAAGLAEVSGKDWTAQDATREAAIALRSENSLKLRELFMAAPAFNEFLVRLSALAAGEIFVPKEFQRSLTTYAVLGEVTEACAPVLEKAFSRRSIGPILGSSSLLLLSNSPTWIVATDLWRRALGSNH